MCAVFSSNVVARKINRRRLANADYLHARLHDRKDAGNDFVASQDVRLFFWHAKDRMCAVFSSCKYVVERKINTRKHADAD